MRDYFAGLRLNNLVVVSLLVNSPLLVQLENAVFYFERESDAVKLLALSGMP